MNTNKKNIKEICNEVDLIIAGKDIKINYKVIFLHLEIELTQKIDYNDIELLCETVVKIAGIQNRKLRQLENNFWNFINKIPFIMVFAQNIKINDNEKLLPNTDYEDAGKKILSRLVGLAQEIISLKDDNSRSSDLRRSSSLKLLEEMEHYYNIPIAKELFENSIKSKNRNEKIVALEGLDKYYQVTDDELE